MSETKPDPRYYEKRKRRQDYKLLAKYPAVDVERELYNALSEMLSGWRECPDLKCICKVCQGFKVIRLYEEKGI